MTIPGVSESAEQFVCTLLGTGLALSDLVTELAESLPPDRYPGEEPTAVVLEMLCGTIATAIEAVDASEVRRATELIELAHDRTIEHLRLAVALSRRMHDGDAPSRPQG